MRYRKSTAILLLLTPLVSIILLTVPVQAVEAYSVSASPTYSQEINAGTTLQLSVVNATTFTTYTFTWRVTDPAGATTTASKSTGSFFSTTFVQSVVFPRDFSSGAVTNYVGNYTVRIDQTAPSAKTNVASSQFEIGLAPSKTLKRTYTVALKAQGYTGSDNVTVDIQHGGTSLPGFPAFLSANTSGLVSFQWRPPPSTALGPSILSFRGSSTLKIPSDTQTISILSANLTVSGLTLIPGILERTQSVEARFSVSYLSGVSVLSGSTAVRIVESDGITTHYIIASYNTTLALFRGTYRVGLNGLTGAWTVYVDKNSTDDTYGNVGPTTPASAQLAVQQATLSVVVSPLSQQYQTGQTISLYATILSPDGTAFNSGTVTFRISNSGQTGNPFSMSYTPTVGWTGSYTVATNDLPGKWTITVQASDSYGNHGQAIVSTTLVSTSTGSPAAAPLISVPLFLFLIAVVGAGSGIGGTLLWRSRTAADVLPFDSLFQLLGGEIPGKSAVLIVGAQSEDARALAFRLAGRTLGRGGACTLLAYGAGPGQLASRMKKYGWHPEPFTEKGTLSQMDCSIGGQGADVKNPLDFGEVGVKVSATLEKAATVASPTIVLIDSLTDMFRVSTPRKVVGFLSLLAEMVKNEKGVLLLPVEKDAIPAEATGVVDGLSDGIIELGIGQGGRKTLTVRKAFGRQVKPPPVEYDISKRRGL